MYIKQLVSGAAAAIVVAIGMPLSALAAGNTVTVTQQNQQGWSTADTRPGGAVNFIKDTTSPAPNGALQLTTDATTAAKAQYLHAANTPLANINSLSYYTKQVSASFAKGDPSYQLPAHLNGTTGFTTLVFEPYQSATDGQQVLPTVWQKWDVASGLFYSTRPVVCSNGIIAGGSGGPANYTLAQVKTACPNAVINGFGVNIGSNNPSYNVETDLVNFNGTTYDFQATKIPTNKDQCKKDGYLGFTDGSAVTFKNQGSCVSYVNNASSVMSESESEF